MIDIKNDSAMTRPAIMKKTRRSLRWRLMTSTTTTMAVGERTRNAIPSVNREAVHRTVSEQPRV